MGASHAKGRPASPSPSPPPFALKRRCSSGAVQSELLSKGCCVFHGRLGKRGSTVRVNNKGSSSDDVVTGDGVFDPSRSHPTVALLISDLKEDGVLDDLDRMAAEVATRKVSPLNQDLTLRQQHDQPCAPVKPSKRTRSILRRVSSVTQGGGDTFPLSVDNNTDARRTARRLTWNDKETNGTGSGGKLEHVRLYNKNDDMSTCSYVGPYRSTAAARRKSTGSHSNASSDSGSLNTSVARGSSLNSTFRSDGGGDVIIPSSTLDRTAQSAVQRIAMQLMKHEATNGDTSELSSMERCGKMLKRKVTAKVAALVEAVAASDTSSAAGAGASSSSSHAGDELRRPVTTAGDALLTYLTAENAAIQREYATSETEMESSQQCVLQLLGQVDAMSDAVPSRRIATALRDMHRSMLQLIDTRMKSQALASAKKYLRSIVLDGKNIADEVSHVVCSLRRSSSDHGIVYGAQSDTMAGEFFYVLALGGLLRQT